MSAAVCRFGVSDYDPEIGSWLSKDPIKFAANDTTKPSGFYEVKDPPCTLLCIFTDKEFKKKQEDDRCKL